ncbi:PepSY domain-containing protein [Jannaschia seohaensis]|uniref:PepSY domain-containing protein n=1 Tax=Jannaschia seohaensis TaxID=475081 RepID=A0A2Y9AK09_9RHOB|nr:PepSY domain-containing protein [Jannaschia seohaensis]PWJ20332.1 hypothetical protein BCF38_103147 [Jannaschia seohaensis]SSA44376.1 hypothetical protein SAMN05421539_103147 [Jannaschia seohaensis]
MTKTLTAFAVIALLPTGAALADDDACISARDQWQPLDAAVALAQEKGWTVSELEIEDGCYEMEGRDGDGRKIEVKLDPATLQVVEMEYDDDRRTARAPAGTEAAPQVRQN